MLFWIWLHLSTNRHYVLIIKKKENGKEVKSVSELTYKIIFSCTYDSVVKKYSIFKTVEGIPYNHMGIIRCGH